MEDPEFQARNEDRESSPEAQIEKPQDEYACPEGGGRGWAVALGCSGLLFCTFGFANAFGVFQEYYQKHQLSSETPSNIAWIGSLQVFFLLGGNCFGGPLFDRYGAKVIWPSVAVYIFAIFITSACKELYQFILAQGVLAGISMGMTMAPGMAATSQYFNKKRGAAMGIAVAGSSLGGVIFPIALNKMLNNPSLGFGWTVRILGFLILAVILPSAFCIRARLPPRNKDFFLPSAFKEPEYLALIFAVWLGILGVFVPIFYLPSYAVYYGMSTELAFYLTAILNGASFFGRVIPGILADKVGRLNMLSFMAVSTGILGLCWQKVTSNAALIVFAAIYGFTSGAIVSLMTACLAQIPKDPKNIGTYMGMGMLVVATGALIGPPISGVLVNHYHGFKQVSIFSGTVSLAGGFAVLFVKQMNPKGVLGKV